MISNYFKSFALLLSLCFVGNVSAQGSLIFGDVINTGGDNYSVEVSYRNNTSATFLPGSISITVGVQGPISNLGGFAPNNAGWASTLVNPSTIRFNGNVNSSLWDASINAENTIGTIQFVQSTSGCVSFQTSSSYLIAFSPFEFRPVSAALTKCTAVGTLSLATTNDDLRERTILSLGTDIINDMVGGVNDATYSLCNVPPGNVIFVSPPQPDYEKINGNVRTSDIVAITQHILGTIPFNENYQIIAADVNTDAFIDVGDIVGIRRGILGLSEDGISAPWFYPTTSSLAQVSFPISYETQYDFSDISSNSTLDFTAVKSGDVNITSQDYDKTLGTKLINISNVSLKSGENTNVPVFIEDINDMLVMSMALQFESNALTLQGLKSGTITIDPSSDYSIDHEAGTLNMILSNLNSEERLNAKEPAFYFQVKANQNLASISSLFKLTSDKVDGEFFEKLPGKSGNAPARIDLEWPEAITPNLTSDFATLSSANPVENDVVIKITSELIQSATFTLFDVTGRLASTGKVALNNGVNTLRLSHEQIPTTPGIYLLRLEDEAGNKATFKLVKK